MGPGQLWRPTPRETSPGQGFLPWDGEGRGLTRGAVDLSDSHRLAAALGAGDPAGVADLGALRALVHQDVVGLDVAVRTPLVRKEKQSHQLKHGAAGRRAQGAMSTMMAAVVGRRCRERGGGGGGGEGLVGRLGLEVGERERAVCPSQHTYHISGRPVE